MNKILKQSKKYLLLLFICSISFFAKSQDSTGTVQFYIYPDTIHILIDNVQKVKSNASVNLPVGYHHILVQGKKLATINQTIKVIKDSTIYFRKIIGYNDAYKKYKSEMNTYTFYRTSFLASTSILVLGGYYLSYAYTKQKIDQQNESKRLAEYYAKKYQSALKESELVEYADKFRSYKKEYDKYRVQKFLMTPLAVLTTYCAYKSFIYYKKIKKPIYLEPLSFNIGYLPGNYTNYSLTYKF